MLLLASSSHPAATKQIGGFEQQVISHDLWTPDSCVIGELVMLIDEGLHSLLLILRHDQQALCPAHRSGRCTSKQAHSLLNAVHHIQMPVGKQQILLKGAPARSPPVALGDLPAGAAAALLLFADTALAARDPSYVEVDMADCFPITDSATPVCVALLLGPLGLVPLADTFTPDSPTLVNEPCSMSVCEVLPLYRLHDRPATANAVSSCSSRGNMAGGGVSYPHKPIDSNTSGGWTTSCKAVAV